ncbi:MAG: hypothetical protein AB4040_13990 [Synechococcus sp.]
MNAIEGFYQEVLQNPCLASEVDSLLEQSDFIEPFIALGKRQGFIFSTSDVEDSILKNTARNQGSYFCLPIGCYERH